MRSLFSLFYPGRGSVGLRSDVLETEPSLQDYSGTNLTASP